MFIITVLTRPNFFITTCSTDDNWQKLHLSSASNHIVNCLYIFIVWMQTCRFWYCLSICVCVAMLTEWWEVLQIIDRILFSASLSPAGTFRNWKLLLAFLYLTNLINLIYMYSINLNLIKNLLRRHAEWASTHGK